MRDLVLCLGVLALVGCPRKPAPVPEPETPTASETESGEQVEAEAVAVDETDRFIGSTVVLDGAEVEARWDDGDTFSMPNPEGGRRIRARLDGFNTLESYGPVHRWGDWTAVELYGLAKEAGERARSQTWTCHRQEGSGGYGRIRVDCPDLRHALISEGLAHVFGIEEGGSDDLLATQREAIEAGRGMWAKGAPEGLITSLHSLDEKGGETSYNRIADLATGLAAKHEHRETYAVCEEVCQMGSCMVYVPFELRYDEEDKADCLRGTP